MRSESTAMRLLGIFIRIGLLIIAAMFVVQVARTAYGYGYAIFAQEPVARDGAGYAVTVTVGADDSVGDVAKTLTDKGLIRDAMLFRLQERFSDYHGKIAPGTYELSTAMTPEEMLAVMSARTLELEEADEIEGNSVIGGMEDDESVDLVPEGDVTGDPEEDAPADPEEDNIP